MTSLWKLVKKKLGESSKLSNGRHSQILLLINTDGYILRKHGLFHFCRNSKYKVYLEYSLFLFQQKYFCAFFPSLLEGKRVGHILFRYAYCCQALIFNCFNVSWSDLFAFNYLYKASHTYVYIYFIAYRLSHRKLIRNLILLFTKWPWASYLKPLNLFSWL